ncbi:DUF1266 domain-containing protein [Pseudomonas protegens]|uniref:DUF1266 domain-containing protein n=1 Tax=Pseudomonas protegens TaxID=380021 RepID=UPI003EB746A8
MKLSFDGVVFSEWFIIAAVLLGSVLLSGVLLWYCYRCYLKRVSEDIAFAQSDDVSIGPEQYSSHWGLAVGAMYTAHGGSSWAQFTSHEERGVDILREQWGISDRGSFLMQLYDVLCFGHRHYFHRIIAEISLMSEDEFLTEIESVRGRQLLWRLRAARLNENDIQSINFSAWDMSRYVRMTLRGVTAGYIIEAEAADLICLAALQIQHDFRSWQEFAEHFLHARWFWCADDTALETQEEYVNIIEGLLKDERSPWRILPWNQALPAPQFVLVSALDELGLIEILQEEKTSTFWWDWESLLDKELQRYRQLVTR